MPSRKYRELPLKFNFGQVSAYEESLLPEGAVALLENWSPEETGGLRVPEGWKKSSTTGGPATAKGLGATLHSVTRTPNYRQKTVAQGTTGTGSNPKTISVSWGQTTLSGNTLLVKVSIRLRDLTTYHIPTSFGGYGLLIPPNLGSSTAGFITFWLLKEDAAAESTITLTFTCGTATDELVWLVEATELLSVDDAGTPKNLLDCTTSTTCWRRNDGIAGISVIPGWQNDLNVVTANHSGDGDAPHDNTASGTPASGISFIVVTIPISTLIKFGTLGGTSGAPVAGSTQYTGSIWLRSGSGGTHTTRLNILWYDSGGGLISTSNGTGAALTGSYVRYTVTATSPSGAVFAKIQVETTTTMGTAETIFLSGPQLELGASATDWVHGQISSIDQYSVGVDTTDPVAVSAPDATVPVSWSEASVAMHNHTAAASGVWGSYTESSDQERIDISTERVWMTSAYKSLVTTLAQSDSVTVTNFSVSGNWIVGNFKISASASDTDVFYVATQNDTTDFDVYYINKADIDSGSWTSLATGLTAGTGTGDIPVAFASGLGILFLTHPNLTKSKMWKGIGFTLDDATGSLGGLCCEFFKSRFFVAGVDAVPTRLFYSDAGSATSWPATNTIEIGQSDGYLIEDMATQENQLIIGKGNAIFSLSGSGASNWNLYQYPTGNAAPGRSVVATPYGTVVAGTRGVWITSGTAVEQISKNIGAAYAPSGYVFAGYEDDHVYILDKTGEKIFVCDLRNQSWYVEKHVSSNNQTVTLAAAQDRLLAQPKSSTDTGLIMYKSLPSLTRTRDFSPITRTALVETGVVWPEGPGVKFTPQKLYLQIRQRGTGTEDMTIQPVYYDEAGATVGTTDTFNNRAAAGVYRHRMDLGQRRGVMGVEFIVTGPSTGNQFDIESAILGYDVEEVV